jgi:hypothetical protein
VNHSYGAAFAPVVSRLRFRGLRPTEATRGIKLVEPLPDLHRAGEGVYFGMLVRYGLAQVLACLPALAVVVGALIAGEKIKGPGLAKLVRTAGLLTAAILAFVAFTFSTVVWVVDEGDGGTLAARRYLLWGDRGTVETLEGRQIEFPVGEGVDVVVNATRADIVVETVQYGGVFASDEKPERLHPGQTLTCHSHIANVGEPPDRARVKESSPVSVQKWIRRPR